MRNMTLQNITKTVGGTLYNAEKAEFKEVSGVVIDSRLVKKDYLFIAVKGERVDGHSFVKQVFEGGAALAIVEKEMPDITDKPYIVVESSLKALRELAAYYREGLDIKVVGITGSVGKTSTKEFIAAVLGTGYSVLKTAGNFNNEIGLPLTVFGINDSHNIAVLEMGISDFGEMTRLSAIAKPDICVITNIGICHLENLGTRDGILKAKTEIFENANKDFVAVLNGDDDKLSTVKIENDMFFYSMSGAGSVCAKNITPRGIEGTHCTIETPEGEFDVNISIPGIHMVSNALAATSVGLLLGLSIGQIKSGIESLETIGGRLNIIKSNDIVIIDDCYNANPVSVKASIDVLDYANSRRVAVLGDMFELGANENELHYSIGQYISKKETDVVVCIGSLSRHTYDGLKKSGYKGEVYYFETVDEFLENKDRVVKKGDTILVKASHSMHFEKIVTALR